jgi:ABC-2 type transport system permease protein
MSAKSHSMVMLRRNFKHIARNPTSVFNAVVMPVVIMLMFVYMLGDAFNVGVDYVDYATPGLMLLAACYGLGATATSVNSDMTKGIINRFKVMDVSRGAVLTGHVVASLLTNLVAIGAIVGVAFLLGFSPSAGLLDWLGVVGVVVLLGFAAGWLTVALGLVAKSVETAGLAAGHAAQRRTLRRRRDSRPRLVRRHRARRVPVGAFHVHEASVTATS